MVVHRADKPDGLPALFLRLKSSIQKGRNDKGSCPLLCFRMNKSQIIAGVISCSHGSVKYFSQNGLQGLA